MSKCRVSPYMGICISGVLLTHVPHVPNHQSRHRAIADHVIMSDSKLCRNVTSRSIGRPSVVRRFCSSAVSAARCSST